MKLQRKISDPGGILRETRSYVATGMYATRAVIISNQF